MGAQLCMSSFLLTRSLRAAPLRKGTIPRCPPCRRAYPSASTPAKETWAPSCHQCTISTNSGGRRSGGPPGQSWRPARVLGHQLRPDGGLKQDPPLALRLPGPRNLGPQWCRGYRPDLALGTGQEGQRPALAAPHPAPMPHTGACRLDCKWILSHELSQAQLGEQTGGRQGGAWTPPKSCRSRGLRLASLLYHLLAV